MDQASLMSEMDKTIAVKKIIDRITVRKEVREAAHRLNLDTRKQARISMAVYHVIDKMNMGMKCEGEVYVHHYQEGMREGIQVICTANNARNDEFDLRLFTDMSWLVDELDVEKLTSNSTRVILMVWTN